MDIGGWGVLFVWLGLLAMNLPGIGLIVGLVAAYRGRRWGLHLITASLVLTVVISLSAIWLWPS